jgi:putative ABC transport system permease protein
MKLLVMAWRNVFRHTRRSVITAAAISVGLAAMILMDTMMNGVDSLGAKNITDNETGQMEIFARGYYREEGVLPLDTVIDNPDPVIALVKKIRGVAGVTQRLKFPARLNNGIDELPVIAVGIDLAHEDDVFKIHQAVVKGKYLSDPGECLIGAELAQDMQADVGSMLTLICRDRNGTYNAYDFMVAGLLNSGHPLIDRNAVLVELPVIQELMAMPDQVTELCIRSDPHPEKIKLLKKEIEKNLGQNYEVFAWDELNASIFRIIGIKRTVGFLLSVIVLVIAAVGIVNTMLMAVMERIPEIGTLKAMGFPNSKITEMFLYEGGIIGLFGSGLGCFFGFLTSLYLVFVGIDYSNQFKNAVMNMPMKWVFKGELSMGTILWVFLFGVAVCVLVTLLPVRKAVRLEPIDALRHV